MTATDVVASSTYSPFDPTTSNGAPAKVDNAEASKDMFLQLLVAQLAHQDPENPADGTQFVTQLAQFTSLEQSTQMGQDISAIRAVLAPSAPATTGSSTDPSKSSSTPPA